jgi:hypothetical protein
MLSHVVQKCVELIVSQKRILTNEGECMVQKDAARSLIVEDKRQ